MSLPNHWEKAGLEGFDGAVWFRKEVTVSEQFAKEKDLQLRLSTIDDMDSTWLNGVKIGGLRGWDRNRNFSIPDGLLKPGKNVIAIRVIDWIGNGGINGQKEDMVLSGKNENISLAGEWNYKVGCPVSELVPIGDDKRMYMMPTALYNGMLHPLLPLSIQGAIWYQGEANTSKALQYQTLFPAIIKDWRTRFGQGDFPFLFVQLANYEKPDALPPIKSTWAELREAQTMTLSLPNTGMATAIDIGEENDIHPRNKQDVGRRLALLALAKTYGQNNPCENPVIDKAVKQGNQIKVSFKFVFDGIKNKDKYGYIKGFAVSGADKKFYWAKAVLEKNEVLVSSPEVPSPEYIRYGWSNNPDDLSLYNSADLPVIPFRTDP